MKKKSTGNERSKFFLAALREAKKADKKNEVPIGAILVKEGKIISKSFNETEKRNSFLAHAEMLCIEKACKKLRTKYLNNCELYITLEPCQMCFAAAKLSRARPFWAGKVMSATRRHEAIAVPGACGPCTKDADCCGQQVCTDGTCGPLIQ